jgi:hypothetical protein|nr:MAG TPA: hypothetical protein [Caudoviricetes sp.]
MSSDREKALRKETNRMKRIFKPLLDDTAYAVSQGLINNAAFMYVTLLSLQEEILLNGCVEEYQNGANQSGIKESSAVKVYNNMIRSYNTVIKNLIGLLPDERQSEVQDSLTAFISK